jgi:prepilin-type N-terminal cleavage/methylation domain-containing protein
MKNNKKITKGSCGFTLVETLVVIFIFSFLAVGVSTLLIYILKDSRGQITTIDNLDNTRLVASNFTNQIRSAVYGNDGGYPIYQAGNSQIIFYSNYGQSTGIQAKFRYFLDGTTLKRGVIVPTINPLNYSSLLEKVTVVQSNLVNTNKPVFYYYDGNYDASIATTSLSQPVNVNNIKYISIKMDVLKDASNPSLGYYTITSGAAIRSLKNNLGN